MAPTEQEVAFKTGFRRGTYTWTINAGLLRRNPRMESSTFVLGGFSWRILLSRRCDANRSERLNVYLVSCNAELVRTDVAFSIVHDRQVLKERPRRSLEIAGPFHGLMNIDVPFERFTTVPLTSKVVVEFDLKNIRSATNSDLEENDVAIVNLEVIDASSIKEWMNKSQLGIASPVRKQKTEVCRGSLMNLWAEHDPDHRYWLCERSDNGVVILQKCLNEEKDLKSFGDFCEDEGDSAWVTLFEEDKGATEGFQQIADDSIIIFSKHWEAPENNLSYVGHHLVRKTKPVGDLLEEITTTMFANQDERAYSAYLEDKVSTPEVITSTEATLQECGISSGSVIILRKCQADENSHFEEDVKDKLTEFAKESHAAVEAETAEHPDENLAEVQFDWDESSSEESLTPVSVMDYHVDVFGSDMEDVVIVDSFPVPHETVFSDPESPERVSRHR